jgi:hypothetical protein
MAEPVAPGWLDELDLHVGPPDAAMGTRSLDPDRWFLFDDGWEAQRVEAARLVADERDEVLVGTDDPSLRAAVEDLHHVVTAWLGKSRGSVPPVVTDPRDVLEGLAATRLLVADDLCLLLPGPDGWVLAAGCVCFPSYWRPKDRIGGPLDGVHAVVPGYPGTLAGRVDAFLGRLRPGQGVWRRNWLVHDVADLHLPRWVEDVDRPTPVPEGRWLRSERQTLVRLPSTDAVVFTIRTQQVPMGVLRARPDVAGALAGAIRGWSPEQRAYKGAAVDEPLLAWLEEVAAGR